MRKTLFPEILQEIAESFCGVKVSLSRYCEEKEEPYTLEEYREWEGHKNRRGVISDYTSKYFNMVLDDDLVELLVEFVDLYINPHTETEIRHAFKRLELSESECRECRCGNCNFCCGMSNNHFF